MTSEMILVLKEQNRSTGENHRVRWGLVWRCCPRNWLLTLVGEVQTRVTRYDKLTRNQEVTYENICNKIFVRLEKIKKMGNIQYWQRCGATSILMQYFGECKLVQPFWKDYNKLKMYTFWSSNLFPKDILTCSHKENHRKFIRELTKFVRTWN